MDKKIGLAILLATVLIGGALIYRSGGQPATLATIDASGRQIIDITARGGYSPRLISAKAGIATTIRVTTKETYDCSASLVIPKLKYEKFLSSSGTEEIVVPAEKATGTLNGLCGMGMYSFKINFE
jgi:Cu+-exporting ATPase